MFINNLNQIYKVGTNSEFTLCTSFFVQLRLEDFTRQTMPQYFVDSGQLIYLFLFFTLSIRNTIGRGRFLWCLVTSNGKEDVQYHGSS